ncbi:MAG: type II toxin-antitoxin system RelE/ParE family toxin [Gammaproteobacteria bacterium]
MKKELRFYRTREGKEPFVEWIESLKDVTGRAHINNRLNRIAIGHYGDCESVGNGVRELKIHYGPGYRVYFSEQADTIVLLLLGGSKRTQNKDIKKAKQLWEEFKERCYD